jgi:glyoxylase-like metal-dependent hydrolase (beta-lactamase superfamily II)
VDLTPISFPRAAGEALHRVDVGAVAVYPLVQLHYRPDPVRFFPDLPARGIDPAAWYWQAPYIEDGRLVVDMGGFLLRTPTRTILVDLGIGNGKSRPNPNFDHRGDAWLDQLRRTGTEPSDVDTVVYTHLHVDHVGFGTSRESEQEPWLPTFPAAEHLTTQAELDFWTGPVAGAEVARLGDYIGDSVLPLVAAGRLRPVEPDHRICPEVRLRPAAGHTPGNVCVEVDSAGARAVFAGDMVHHPLQLAFPDWSTDYCIDGDEAAKARQALLREVADTGALLFAAHFPGSLPGHIRPDPDGPGYTFAVYSGVVV